MFALLEKIRKFIKNLVFALIVALVCAAVWWWFNRGVSNDDLHEDIQGLSQHIDSRIDGVDSRLGDVGGKLESIEEKLDRLLDIATRPPADVEAQ